MIREVIFSSMRMSYLDICRQLYINICMNQSKKKLKYKDLKFLNAKNVICIGIKSYVF